jgi:hypothetical protein
LIHTYGFLVALEHMKVMASAKMIVDQVRSAGRNFAMDTFEKRNQLATGDVADWQTDYDGSPVGPGRAL